MLITYTEPDENGMGEPVLIVAIGKDGASLQMKFGDAATVEQIEILRQRIDGMLVRGIARLVGRIGATT